MTEPRAELTPGQIAVAAVIGAPIAGAWLIRSNLLARGDARRGRQALLWGIVSTAIVLVVSFYLPDEFPSAVLPAIYTVAIYQIAKQLQGEPPQSRASNWRVVGVGVVCLLILLAVIFGLVMLLPESWIPA